MARCNDNFKRKARRGQHLARRGQRWFWHASAKASGSYGPAPAWWTDIEALRQGIVEWGERFAAQFRPLYKVVEDVLAAYTTAREEQAQALLDALAAKRNEVPS